MSTGFIRQIGCCRFYGFSAGELLDEAHPNFNPYIDPKCNWALNHMALFPVEINTAPQEMLLRVPASASKAAKRIVAARRVGRLDFAGLKKIRRCVKARAVFCDLQWAHGGGTQSNTRSGAAIDAVGALPANATDAFG